MSHVIHLDGITFHDPVSSGKDLEYPLYPGLIDYGKVTNEVRKSLQVEPAFQFLAPEQTAPCEFFLQLAADYAATFAADNAGQPIWREATGTAIVPAPVASVELIGPGRKTVRVVVEPAAWPESAPKVLVVRFFCNRPSDRPSNYQSQNGVSLVLIRPGGSQIGTAASRVPTAAALTIRVVDIGSLPLRATYDIFNPLFELPVALSLEPAFRVSHERYEARVLLEIEPGLLRFVADSSKGDGVPLIQRSDVAARPPELSQVPASDDQRSIHFSWQRPAAQPQPIAFGFYVPVERQDPRTFQWRREEVFIDPILFHDPPPGG